MIGCGSRLGPRQQGSRLLSGLGLLGCLGLDDKRCDLALYLAKGTFELTLGCDRCRAGAIHRGDRLLGLLLGDLQLGLSFAGKHGCTAVGVERIGLGTSQALYVLTSENPAVDGRHGILGSTG
jgi:hypothetical protein